MRDAIREITEEYDCVRGMHGFYLNQVDREISFEVETAFEDDGAERICETLTERIAREYPGHKVSVRANHYCE